MRKFELSLQATSELTELKSQQTQRIHDAIERGLRVISEFETGEQTDEGGSNEFLSSFINFCEIWFSSDDLIFSESNKFHQEMLNLYVSIHEENNFTLEQSLFFEFLIGLTRFVAATIILLNFLKQKDISVPEFSLFNREAGIFSWLKCIAQINSEAVGLMVTEGQYATKPEAFWEDHSIFFQKNPAMLALSKQLVSIQYVPSDTEKIDIMGLAQILHWNGLGGSGAMLEAFPVLSFLSEHALGYHKHRVSQAGYNQRLTPFRLQLDQLKEDSNQLLIEMVKIFEKEGLLEEVINIIDFSAGPAFVAVRQACDFLSERNVAFRLFVSDIDATCLAELLDLKQQVAYLEKVLRIDLTHSELPSFDNKFNYISVSLALHQLSSSQIEKALRYFTSISKEGSIITIPDVGEDGYYQATSAAGNIVDREGYFPNPQTSFNFSEISVPIDATEEFLIPYPLNGYHKQYPGETKFAHISMYSITLFCILRISGVAIEQLQEAWNNQQYREADQIAIQNSPIIQQLFMSSQNSSIFSSVTTTTTTATASVGASDLMKAKC